MYKLLCFFTLGNVVKALALHHVCSTLDFKIILNRTLKSYLFWAQSTLRRKNLKTDVSLWKHIKCFLITLRRRNLKTQKSEAAETLEYTPEHAWQSPFRPPFWICVWGRLGQTNHLIVVTSSFSKSSVFKMFSVHTKTQSSVFKFLRRSVDGALVTWRFT